ncbi:hypothetical protein JOE61_002828 [Nocardioides salarius]|uniref:FHA domain-containing protein n=2 Tax=Nocardioides salarius TaxID=374513 RepID=A0ABS2MCT7_9ACTN|nr:FHA domain-containing protein [Nocardioides salarius]MBM7509014.1 hypothetical protein [Nocardioides salarius]
MTSPDAAAVPPRAYLPGDWYVVLGPRVVVALPASEPERAARAWSLLDAGAGADELLDALLGSGLSTLAGLALVSEHDDATTRVLLRGAARWSAQAQDGEARGSGEGASTWSELLVRDVGSWRLDLPGGPGGPGAHAGASDEPGLRVADGLVRASCVLHGEPDADPDPEPEPQLQPEPHPDPEPDPEPEPEQTTPTPPAAPVEAGPAGEAPAAPGAWGPGESDHDGMTKGGEWGEDLWRHRPGIPGQPQPPSVTASPVARLVVSHGEEVEVDRVVLVGRAPEARRFTSTEQPRLVTVPSPQQEISSTHLEVRPGSGADHGSAVVTDLGSTNGTVLVQPGLPPEPLQPGIAVQLIPGAILDLGDGVSIQVVRP